MEFTLEKLDTLKRSGLQKLCKQYGIRANLKNVEMKEKLMDLLGKAEEATEEDIKNEEEEEEERELENMEKQEEEMKEIVEEVIEEKDSDKEQPNSMENLIAQDSSIFSGLTELLTPESIESDLMPNSLVVEPDVENYSDSCEENWADLKTHTQMTSPQSRTTCLDDTPLSADSEESNNSTYVVDRDSVPSESSVSLLMTPTARKLWSKGAAVAIMSSDGTPTDISSPRRICTPRHSNMNDHTVQMLERDSEAVKEDIMAEVTARMERARAEGGTPIKVGRSGTSWSLPSAQSIGSPASKKNKTPRKNWDKIHNKEIYSKQEGIDSYLDKKKAKATALKPSVAPMKKNVPTSCSASNITAEVNNAKMSASRIPGYLRHTPNTLRRQQAATESLSRRAISTSETSTGTKTSVSRPTFDLQASLTKKLPYKPRTGPLSNTLKQRNHKDSVVKRKTKTVSDFKAERASIREAAVAAARSDF